MQPDVSDPASDLTEISVIQESWFKIYALHKRKFKLSPDGSAPRRLIAVFGGSNVAKGRLQWWRAYSLGRELANRNAVVFNGGYGGVMEASAAGARSVGGDTIGVTCNNLPERQANPYILSEWRLERWDQRLLTLVWLADGYAFMPGSSGTLVELSMVIETQLKGFIPVRPVVCLGAFWEPVVRRIIGGDGMITFAKTPAECADLVTR